jgi:hypothetical protein
MLAPGVARVLSVISVRMAFSFVRMIIGWFDRVLEEPVMRERINKGSDQFFAAEENRWGELEIDGGERVEFKIPKSLAPPTDRR